MVHIPTQIESNAKHGGDWKGGLSLVPLVALFAMGGWLLLREHQMVRQDARDAMRRAASGMGEFLEQEVAVFSWLSDRSSVAKTGRMRGVPELFVIALDPSGEGPKVFPADDSIPRPRPFDWGALDEASIHLWEESQRGDDPNLAMQATIDFLESDPPQPFASLGRFRQVVLLMRESRWRDAALALASLREGVQEGLYYTESGLPLSVALDFCELDLIQTLFEHEGRRSASGIDAILARQWAKPSAWTAQLVDRCGTVERTIFGQEARVDAYLRDVKYRNNAWQRFKDLPLSARREWMSLSGGEARWINFEGEPHFLNCVSTVDSSAVFFAIPLSRFERELGDALRRGGDLIASSADFHFSIYANRRLVFDSQESGIDQNSVRREAAESEDGVILVESTRHPWFLVGATLKDPEFFVRRSRERVLSILGFIGLAAITGISGWVAQRRAYRRQVELGRTKSNFVASVSHELRAPIASIRLLVENLSNQGSRTDPKEREYFKWIELECRRLGSLVQNILQFSRLEHGKQMLTFEPVNVIQLFNQSLVMMSSIADNAQVRLNSRADIGSKDQDGIYLEAFWDGQAIHQALVNLLENSIKHTRKGGGIEAVLEHDAFNDAVSFSVSDEGEGIDRADRERIFLPFERLESEATRRTSGVGIGLSLVRHTVKAHGGDVRVEDSAVGGACFVVSLPLNKNKK